jgi:hypothetical protein
VTLPNGDLVAMVASPRRGRDLQRHRALEWREWSALGSVSADTK